jgi:hypothetical protein
MSMSRIVWGEAERAMQVSQSIHLPPYDILFLVIHLFHLYAPQVSVPEPIWRL